MAMRVATLKVSILVRVGRNAHIYNELRKTTQKSVIKPYKNFG